MLLNSLPLKKYELYSPTWQNEFKSIENVKENYSFMAIIKNKNVLCFGFIHKIKGDIPQIGVLEEWKTKGLEELLIRLLAKQTLAENIIMLNVEEQNYLGEILKRLTFTNLVNQYEMSLSL